MGGQSRACYSSFVRLQPLMALHSLLERGDLAPYVRQGSKHRSCPINAPSMGPACHGTSRDPFTLCPG
jgi:hypothetical protein